MLRLDAREFWEGNWAQAATSVGLGRRFRAPLLAVGRHTPSVLKGLNLVLGCTSLRPRRLSFPQFRNSAAFFRASHLPLRNDSLSDAIPAPQRPGNSLFLCTSKRLLQQQVPRGNTSEKRNPGESPLVARR